MTIGSKWKKCPDFRKWMKISIGIAIGSAFLKSILEKTLKPPYIHIAGAGIFAANIASGYKVMTSYRDCKA